MPLLTTSPTADSPSSPSIRTFHPAIEMLFRRLGEVASLPSIVHRALQVADDQTASVDDLREVIEQDPVLAIRLVQTVNSSYFGLSHEVRDLRVAVSLLGKRQVRNVAITAIVRNAFQPIRSIGQIDPERLWRHSIAVAAIARHVAERSGKVDPDEAYLAGLVHDVGLSVVEQRLPAPLSRVFASYRSGTNWTDAEQAVFSFDHAQLGAYLAWRAGFHESIVSAIDFHHDPLAGGNPAKDLACCIATANYFATRMSCGAIEGRRLILASSVPARLGFSQQDLRQLWHDAEDAMQSIGELASL